MSRKNETRIWRQPIRDRSCRIAAVELLHRHGDAIEACVTDDALATDEVIHLMHDGKGRKEACLPEFVNVDAEMLLSRRVETLRPGGVVLELLETVEVDDRVIRRCGDLKHRGYGIALDDVCCYRDDLEALFGLADIVKVDLQQTGDDDLEDLVEQLRRFPLQLLAEKVESRRSAQRCLALHFDLFQGFYFDAPPHSLPAAGHA